ncbi:hypothetical protein K491DRAFT_166330 [Lophiostoma macrostomum CBS 122681]|uniref:Uncharacterized protein n=1 Tax=Lophiostoma macrostomum CBS 122681 TaxID=1314788 RepID=A0A6A6THV8_9PLEO|nr:hypothetical protein K491DRAFT_166330 [Lophiostoma macrostomum CBS 122681]
MVGWAQHRVSPNCRKGPLPRTKTLRRAPRPKKKPRFDVQEELDDLNIDMVGWTNESQAQSAHNMTRGQKRSTRATRSSTVDRVSRSPIIRDEDLIIDYRSPDCDSENENPQYLMSGALPDERTREPHHIAFVSQPSTDYDPVLDRYRDRPLPSIEPRQPCLLLSNNQRPVF